MLQCKLGLTGLNDSVIRPVFSVFVTSVHMFIAVEWRDGMKNSGWMRDWKSLFWTLSKWCLNLIDSCLGAGNQIPLILYSPTAILDSC